MTTTQHPLTETAAAGLWDEHHTPAHPILCWSLAHESEREATLALLRAAFDAGREHERATPAEITDEMVDAGASYAWETANPGNLGWNSLTQRHKEGCRRDARAVLTAALAAPTPPAEEVALPGELPAHITDVVEADGGDHIAHAALNADGDWCGVDQDGYLHTLTPGQITAFTLPDGTRACRDGEREDGTPRFVECGEGEK